jgi:hypothetical protein
MKSYYPGDNIEYHHEYYKKPSYEETEKMIRPLVDHLGRVDACRLDLFQNTVSISKLQNYNDLLLEPVRIGRNYSGHEIKLPDQDIERKLAHEGFWDFKLSVRKGRMDFPKYYLCEYREFFGRNYGIVLTDYYKSQDYQFTDPRFARMVYYGHESNFIRMSSFRSDVNRLISKENQEKTSDVLKKIGSYFLQGAWHEDQLAAWVVSGVFGLEKFREAIEIIYFILGSDFTETRNYFDEDVEQFFTLVYPRKAFLGMINKIDSSTAEDMQEMERNARDWYRSLNKAFSGLLRTEVNWGPMENMPLYKIIYSNFYRLDKVFPLENSDDSKVNETIKQIEDISQQFFDSIYG